MADKVRGNLRELRLRLERDSCTVGEKIRVKIRADSLTLERSTFLFGLGPSYVLMEFISSPKPRPNNFLHILNSNFTLVTNLHF